MGSSGAAKLGNAQGYRYPHDDPDGVVPQQYPPDEVVGVDYYKPTSHGAEREIAGRLDKLRAIVGEAEAQPGMLREAPITMPVRRLDEAEAARHPVVRQRFPEDEDDGA